MSSHTKYFYKYIFTYFIIYTFSHFIRTRNVFFEIFIFINYNIMKLNYIIGPSHIHHDFTHQIDNEIQTKLLFNNCILDAYRGIPI